MSINFHFFFVVLGLMLFVGCTPKTGLEPTNQTVNNNYYTYITNQYAISTNYIYVTRTVYKTKTTNCAVGITITNYQCGLGCIYIIYDDDFYREHAILDKTEILTGDGMGNGIFVNYSYCLLRTTNVIFFQYLRTQQTNRYTLAWPEDVIITNYKLSLK